jgi:hypothetical protein
MPIAARCWKWSEPRLRTGSIGVRAVIVTLLAVGGFFYVLMGPLVFDAAYWLLGKVVRIQADRRVRIGASLVLAVVYLASMEYIGLNEKPSTQPGATSTTAIAAAASPTVSVTAAATPTIVVTSAPTATPVPTPTPGATSSVTASPSVAPSPSPTVNPRALTVANVTQSLQDNRHLMVSASLQNLKVTIEPGDQIVDVEVHPTSVWNEVWFLKTAGANALVASKAILGWYPTVLRIQVTLDADFTDTFGKSSTEPGVWLIFTKETAQKFDYAGMAKMDSDAIFCDADRYWVHPAIWKNISISDRGCMTSATKG